ncbi:MAG: tol-pal system-associated acyl-CoA thioesterase [Ancalomicrobiaceae bacterium]|nr:tol-pal system-associated acyl-CoA thioesterase [Ancalomicrobiaceae bacterium]
MTSDPNTEAENSHPAHGLSVRVYYEDTDAGGILYHGSHVRFLERGRTEYLRALGIDQSSMLETAPEDRFLFVVRRLELDYLKPARLDDLLTVVTRPLEIGAARLIIEQSILRGEEVILTAVVTVVAIGGDGRPRRIGPDLRQRLMP